LLSDKGRSLRQTLLFGSFLLTLILSGIYLFYPKPIEVINLKITDFILASAQAPESKLDIVTVAIDEASIEKYGQWPWSRYRLAQLLEKIAVGGAKSTGIDILFAERDRTSPRVWQKTLKDNFGYSIDTSSIPSAILDYDIYLANVLAKGAYVLGYSFVFGETATNPPSYVSHPVSLAFRGGDNSPAKTMNFYQADRVISNYRVLDEAASGSGFLNGTPDIDGVLRRLPLLIEYDNKVFPSFALAVLMQFRRHDVLILQAGKAGISLLSLADFDFPIDERGNFLLGPAKTKKSTKFSAIEVLEGQIKPDAFKDKIVLVGLTAAGLTQEYPTPLSPSNCSLDLHKYALESLTSGLYSNRTRMFPIWETAFSFLLCLILAECIVHLSTAWTIIVSWISLCCCWFAALIIYQSSGYLFSPLLPTLSVSLSSCLLLILKFYHFQQQAKEESGDTLLLLKSSEANLESILKTIPDIVFRLDPQGNITFISPAISKYLKSPQPLLGRPIFELVAPEDLGKAQHHLNERRTGERATMDLEIRLLLTKEFGESTETRRFFSLSAEGIYHSNDPTGKRFLGTQGIVRDITNRKRLELQLIQAQKMEVIGNLAAGVAHDLNNILSGLVSYPDLLLLEIPKNDPLYKKIQVIQKSGKKAATIVQDLLTLARRSITIDETCNINVIISEYFESAEFQLIKKRHQNIVIHTNLQEGLLNVKGSATHLSKVIMNILSNSLEAMPAGGDITISTVNIYVDTFLPGYENIPKGEYVCTSVSDSGVGIPEDDVQRIFEPFYSKKSMHLSGTGLGMTIIWATIKDHKGYIDIQSTVGEGTTFKFYLPITRESIAPQQNRVVLNDYLGSESILIVDDIPEQTDIAKNMLTKLGYTVDTAISGEKALKLIKKHPVDLVILDMIMPGGLDGLETYKGIIQLYPHQKAIITSGFSESKRVKELLHLGAGNYVQKPYTMEKLGMAVRGELDRKKER
jgi:two-component system, cell cycle sensor histidine kinase and response regulator CckA